MREYKNSTDYFESNKAELEKLGCTKEITKKVWNDGRADMRTEVFRVFKENPQLFGGKITETITFKIFT